MSEDKSNKPVWVPMNEGYTIPAPQPTEQRGFNMPTPQPQNSQQSNQGSSNTQAEQTTKK